jgi:hypothetical protein
MQTEQSDFKFGAERTAIAWAVVVAGNLVFASVDLPGSNSMDARK